MVDNVLRLFVTELEPIRPRFQINDIMSDQAREALKFSSVKQEERGSRLSWNDKYDCFVQYRPFQIVISNGGKREMVINEFDSFYFEPYRLRRSYDDCEGDDCPSEPDDVKELWEERFVLLTHSDLMASHFSICAT